MICIRLIKANKNYLTILNICYILLKITGNMVKIEGANNGGYRPSKTEIYR